MSFRGVEVTGQGPMYDGIYLSQKNALDGQTSFEESRWEHYQSLQQQQEGTLTTEDSEEKKVTIAPKSSDSLKADALSLSSSSGKTWIAVACIIAGFLFFAASGFGAISLFAPLQSLPHWLSSFIGTIGHAGTMPFWGMFLGGAILGSIAAGSAIYATCRKEEPNKNLSSEIEESASSSD